MGLRTLMMATGLWVATLIGAGCGRAKPMAVGSSGGSNAGSNSGGRGQAGSTDPGGAGGRGSGGGAGSPLGEMGVAGASGSCGALFADQGPVTASTPPGQYVAADVNGDGQPDLVGTGTSYGIAVALNDGAGAFGATVDHPAVTSDRAVGPYAVAVGDLNGDGERDVAVTEGLGLGQTPRGPSTVHVFLNRGAGRFDDSGSYPVGTGAFDVVIADLDGNARPDLVVASVSSMVSLLNNGDGSFATASTVVSSSTGEFAVGDLDGDGKADLVYLVSIAGSASLLNVQRGNGDATFAAPVSYPTPGTFRKPRLFDVNGDGHTDVVVASGSGTAVSLSVYLNAGEGSLSPPAQHILADWPDHVLGGDFNGDGKLDLVAVGDMGTISLFLNDGNGGHRLVGCRYASFGSPTAAMDLNHDGRTDLVVDGRALLSIIPLP